MKNGGGHFAPKLGGHFELESDGQFRPESGGQFDRFFQQSKTNIVSNRCYMTFLFSIFFTNKS